MKPNNILEPNKVWVIWSLGYSVRLTKPDKEKIIWFEFG